MSNIPDYINKITEFKIQKANLIDQLNNIDKEIEAIIIEWQKECTHPAEYITDGKCSACGYIVEVIENADD